MATRRKTTDDERLDDASIERVIELLEPQEEGKRAGTKKDACQILGIAYNVTRLAKIIEDYKKGKAREAERRAALRGKPATNDEVVYVISEYLEGATIDAITKSTYRPVNFVKYILEKNAVPIRATSHDYFKPELIPEGATRDRFRVGERVYSARYDSIAEVEAESVGKHGEWVYRIWLLAEKWRQYAYQEACELASLEHLRAIGVKV
jgi:hypothetical protein